MARQMTFERLLRNRALENGEYPVHARPAGIYEYPTVRGATTGQTYKQQRAWAIAIDSLYYPDSHKTRIGH